MKLQSLPLMLALSLCAFAQDINGVSISGTPDNPMIVNNNPAKAVCGWTVTRFDAEGNQLPADRIVLAGELRDKDNPCIQPGESQKPQIHNVINFSARGVAARVELDSVLFRDGEIAGPDTMYDERDPELGALAGFTHQLQTIQEEFGRTPRILNLPTPHNTVQEKPSRNTIKPDALRMIPEDFLPPPCSNNGQCWPIQYYCCDQSISGIVYGTPYGIETPKVGGSAVCGPGSPQQGYGIGDNINATIFCPVSEYFGFSNQTTKRLDMQPDRIAQAFSIYDPYNNAVQNSARFHELCAYAQLPNRGGQGPFGKGVVEYNYQFGCP